MNEPTVTTKQGKVQGTIVKSVLGAFYIAFYEIPFAAPPVRELRFKDPEPPAPWTDIRNCTKYTKKICVQARQHPPYNVIGNEDCLYLNVYTNSVSGSKPVMFWIHGGKFTTGSASPELMSPDYLVAKDVVFVSANYRLGAFGFLNLGHRVASGNQALKDLIAALQWVKENIANFGGDPGNVTIFGQSAGGAITHALSISPKARGLFHKAILQSGFLTANWSSGQFVAERSFKLASILGITSTDPEEVVEMLRKVPDKDIVGAYSSIITRQDLELYELPFGVSYDGMADDPVLPLPIEQLYSNDNSIPIMAGYLPYECSMFCNANGEERMEIYNNYLPEYVKVLGKLEKLGPVELEELLKTVKDWYFDGQPISIKKLDMFIYFQTYVFFIAPLKLYLRDRLKRTSTPTYVYRFSYVGNENTFTDLRCKRLVNGASHMDELAYLFYSPICKAKNREPPANGTKDRIILERLTTMWTNFARTGNPTTCHDDFVKTSWKPATKDNFYCLDIGEESELVTKEPELLRSSN
ncbi:esterase E4-like [Colletes latitarsis]|uniref:esterase E4-like n=1 Tax=Colletes latitarsis TaxID=2605962 RepID=UPI004035A0C6